MAGNKRIGNLYVSLGLNATPFSRGMHDANMKLKDSSKLAKKASGSFMQLGASFKALAGVAGVALVVKGLSRLNDYMQESIKLAQTQEDAEKKLTTALGRRSQALIDQAAALQQVTTYGDEAIIEAQALIAAFVKDEEQIKAATKATLDLAAAKGMDLKNAADLVSKTLGSSTNALSRYGIAVEGDVGSTERLSSLTTEIARVFGGQAAAAAETYSGKIQQLSNKYGDMREQLGFAVMKSGAFDRVLETLNPAVDELTTYIANHKDDIGDFASSMASMVIDAGKGAIKIGKDLTPALRGMVGVLEQIGAMVDAIPGGWGTIFGAAAGKKLGAPGMIAGAVIGGTMAEGSSVERSRRAILEARKRREADMVANMVSGADYIKAIREGRDPFANSVPSAGEETTLGDSSGGNGDKYQQQLQKRVEALRTSLMSEKELLNAWYAEQLELIAEYYGKENDVRTEAGQLRLAVAEEYKEKMAEIEGIPAMMKELAALQNHFKSERELTIEYYDQKLADLIEWKDKGIATEQEYAELETALLKEKQDELTRIEKEGTEKRQRISEAFGSAYYSIAQNTFALVRALSEGESKKAFNIQKTAALAAAALSAAETIPHAYKEGVKIGGPPLGTAYAIAAGLAQAANIAAIASQSYSSSGGAASGSVAPSATTTAGSGEISSRSVTIYGLDPSNLYTGEQIAELLNEFVADGGKLMIK